MDFKDFFLVGAGKKLEKAYIYIDSGKYDKARSLLEPAYKKEPQNTGLMLALLQCYIFEKKHSDATRLISRALQTDKVLEDEIASLVKGIEEGGGDGSFCYSHLSDYHIKHRNLKKSFEYIERLSSSALAKETEKAGRQCKSFIQKDSASQRSGIDIFYKFSMLLERAKKYSEMIKILEIIVNANPSEIENIASVINSAITRNYNIPHIRISLGDFYIKAGKIDNALSEYSKVLSSNKAAAPEIAGKLKEVHTNFPDSEPVASLFVEALHKSGKTKEAVRVIEDMFLKDEKHLRFALEKITMIKRSSESDSHVNILFGKLCIKGGDIKKAVHAFSVAREGGASQKELLLPMKEALKADPENPRLNEMLGDIYREEGMLSKAAGFYSRLLNVEGKILTLFTKATELLKRDCSNKEILLFAGRVCFKNSNVTRGSLILRSLLKLDESLAERVLEILPEVDNNQLKIARAECLVIMEKPESALPLFQELLSDKGNLIRCAHLLVRLGKNCRQSVNQIDSIFSTFGDNNIALFGRGEIACYCGNYKQGVEFFKKVLEKNPEYTTTVRSFLESQLEKNPSGEDIRLGLVDIYFSQELYNQITPLLDKLLKDSPDKAALVIDKYRKLLEKYPDSPGLLLGLSKGYILTGQPLSAIEGCSKALASTHDKTIISEIEQTMAKAYVDSGSLSQAVRRYFSAFSNDNGCADFVLSELRKIRDIDSSLVDNYLAIGKIHAFLGNYEAGLRNYEDCYATKTESGVKILADIDNYYSSYGPSKIIAADICLKAGDFKKVLEYLQQVPKNDFKLCRKAADRYKSILVKFPDSHSSHLGLGQCYTALSLYEDAVRSYGKAVKINAGLGNKVIKFLKDIIDMQPDLGAPYFLTCQIYMARKEIKSALSLLSSIPDKICSEGQGISAILEEIALSSDNNFQTLFAVGKLFSKTGNIDRALDFYSTLLDLPAPDYQRLVEELSSIVNHSGSPRAYMIRARVNIKNAKFDQAVLDIERAIDGDSSKLKEAIEILKIIRTKNSRHFRALLLSLEYFAILGNNDSIDEIFENISINSWSGKEKEKLLILKAFHFESTGRTAEAKKMFKEYYDNASDMNDALLAIHEIVISRTKLKAKTAAEKHTKYAPVIETIAERFPTEKLLNLLSENELSEEMRRKICALNRICAKNYYDAVTFVGKEDKLLKAFCYDCSGRIIESSAFIEEALDLEESPELRNKLHQNYSSIVCSNLGNRPEVLTGISAVNMNLQLLVENKSNEEEKS